MDNRQQQASMAIAILVQGIDQVIGKSGLTRQQIIDLDWAIKTLTQPPEAPSENGKKELEKTTQKS